MKLSLRPTGIALLAAWFGMVETRARFAGAKWFFLIASALAGCVVVGPARGATVTGEIVDAATGKPIPARLYLHNDTGQWFFPKSANAAGSAIRYERQNWANKRAVEMHTTHSAHPFTVELEPGDYTFLVERGKEYLPLTNRVQVGAQPVKIRFALRRWANLAARGWFSGDTHNHRDPAELPNVMLAEDVNVALPMTHWTTVETVPPSQSPRNLKGDFTAALTRVDATHVLWPRNTEYEIFTTGKKSHTLGALLVVHHRQPLDLPALPVSRVAARARSEGALLDLEKHNWPWSLALVPLVKPDLYELANNHHWRVAYSITNWAEPAPAWMNLGTGGGSEREWTLSGFQTYYALLNSGFRLSPAAGTANGVHPVPLGFGRVYVHLGRNFDFDAWMSGLKAGRSFVTTGPMLLAEVNRELPGHTFAARGGQPQKLKLKGTVLSEQPVHAIELIVNGDVASTVPLKPKRTKEGAWEASFTSDWTCDASAWMAFRCFEPRDGERFRFAHTAPWFVNVPGQPLRPKRREVEWFIESVRKELARSASLLPPEAVAEYQQALAAYEALLRQAR